MKSVCLANMKIGVGCTALYKLTVVQFCNLCTWEKEHGGLEDQGHS